VDPSLAIPVEIQEQILAFEPRLGGSYHAVLGVARDAKDKDIKRAYFQLSKVFHPDRYFGRETGPFAPRLDRIFKKVALAYELLMDPTTRAELERSMASAPPEPELEAGAAGSEAGAAPRKPTRRQMLARLRRQFRIPEEILAERRFKARQFREAAKVATHQKKWNDAASSIRLAIAFDPWTDEYKEDFALIQAEVNQLRAAQLLDEASGAWDARSRSQALRLYEEAMGYRPSDPEIHAKAAQVACELEAFDQAFEYAERACELAPEVGAHQLVLSRALRGQGLRQKALAALEAARNLDPGNPAILEELKRFRQRPGRPSGGKP
jgi:curved DNA-binding protein CbpA